LGWHSRKNASPYYFWEVSVNQLKTDDLDIPWFVIEETDEVFAGNTNRQICYQSNFGPVQISLNSIQSIPPYPPLPAYGLSFGFAQDKPHGRRAGIV
jgi:hypothetical protein